MDNQGGPARLQFRINSDGILGRTQLLQSGKRWAPGAELKALSGRTIDVPACYIGGNRDWATYQSPGAFESMRAACSQLRSVHLIEQAGHSLAEERPQEVNAALLAFLIAARTASV